MRNATQKEIDNLLSFLQVSKGENVYLEYVFQAKNFTDFIYRGAVVEQLTKYNDELIDDMYKKIEENKALQVQLQKDIEKGEQTIKTLEEKLKTSNLTLDDLIEDETDAEAEYAASKKEVQYYEKIFKEKSTNKWANDKNNDEWYGKNTFSKTNKSNDETNE
mgnify:CR=1 FL=1